MGSAPVRVMPSLAKKGAIVVRGFGSSTETSM